jgi:hypothetical protein
VVISIVVMVASEQLPAAAAQPHPLALVGGLQRERDEQLPHPDAVGIGIRRVLKQRLQLRIGLQDGLALVPGLDVQRHRPLERVLDVERRQLHRGTSKRTGRVRRAQDY